MRKLIFALIVFGLLTAPAHFVSAAGKGKGKGQDKVPPGLEKHGGVPPGQAKKTGDASTNAAETTPKPPKAEPPKTPEAPDPAPAPPPVPPAPSKPAPTTGRPFKKPPSSPSTVVVPRPVTPPPQQRPEPPKAITTNQPPGTVKVPDVGQTNQVSRTRTNRFFRPFRTKKQQD